MADEPKTSSEGSRQGILAAADHIYRQLEALIWLRGLAWLLVSGRL